MNRFLLPDLGEGLEDALIVDWHVSQGEHVTAGQPMVAVETAKAIVDVPAPVSGVLVTQGAMPGDTLAVGGLLAEIDEGDAKQDTYTGIVGEIGKPDLAPAQATTTAETDKQAGSAVNSQLRTSLPDAVKALPAVRSAAAEREIDLATVTGTGPEGSITLDDLDRATSLAAVDSDRATAARKRMASIMADSASRVVPVTVTELADVHDWPAETDATTRILQAVVQACQVEPQLNAWFDESTQLGKPQATIDIGVATDTRDGLFVPVLRNAASLDAGQIRSELDRLLALTHSGKLSVEQMQRPTITCSNFGNLGGRFANLVVVPPQVAIIGTGAIKPAVVPAEDGIRIRRTLPVSLTCDHRAITGGEALRFLNAFIAYLQAESGNPEQGVNNEPV